MTAREQLLVVLTAGSGRQTIRPAPADLRFSSTAPGGYEALTCTLDWPEGWPPDDTLTLGSIAQVVDGRSGEVVWHGQVVDPGTTRSSEAASQQISAQGFSRRLSLNAGPVGYVDRRLESWERGASFAAGQHQITQDTVLLPQHTGDWEEPTPAVIMQTMPEGSKLKLDPSQLYSTYLHPRWSSSNQDIAIILFSVDAIGVSSYFRAGIRVWNQDRSVSNVVMDLPYASVNANYHSYRFLSSGTWTMTDARQADLMLTYDNTVVDEAARDWWLKWGNLAITFTRVDRAGNRVTSPTTYIRVMDIVNDVIGRWLRDDFEIPAVIEQPSDLVSQACWWEGTTAQAVLDAMAEIAPDYVWTVWEPDSPGGKPRFEYESWLREPRYIIPHTAATVRLEGGLDEVFNECVVGYMTSGGVQATWTVTGDVPELTAAGETRSMLLDLTGEGPMSRSAAAKRGQAALAQADVRRTSGTATVHAPIFDRKWNRMVEPWEIRPGHPVVLGESPRADSGTTYSSTGERDGRTTFRLTGTAFSAGTGTCELTLDGGGKTIWRRLKQPVPK